MGKNFFHLLRIARVLIKHNLDEFVSVLHLFRPYTFVFKVAPKSWRRSGDLPRGHDCAKHWKSWGRYSSNSARCFPPRPDLLPADISEELIRLQDDVPPFAGEDARAIIEQAYGDS